MTLYELTAEFETLLAAASDGEDIDWAAIEALQISIADKLDGYAKVLKVLDGQEAAIRTEEDRLAARRRTIGNNKAAMKTRMQEAMERVGAEDIKTALFSFKIQPNSPKVVIMDIDSFAQNSEYWKPRKYVEAELDKTKIKEDIQAGLEVDGAELVRERSLRIR